MGDPIDVGDALCKKNSPFEYNTQQGQNLKKEIYYYETQTYISPPPPPGLV